jgi:fluoride exporter
VPPADLGLRAALLVAAGGATGALARWVAGAFLTRAFPWGTLFVNVVGSFLIGLFMFGGLAKGWWGADARLFFAIGFLGAFTTMSSLALDAMSFADAGDWTRAGLVVLANVGLSLLAVWLGRAVAYAVPAAG